jgi:hypothetical protein
MDFVNHASYCLKCKNYTLSENGFTTKTKNNKALLNSTCSACKAKKCLFIKTRIMGKGLDDSSKEIKEIYYNPETGYSGVNDIMKKANENKTKVETFLNTQDIYTLHKPLRKNFKRRKIYVHNIDDQWQADLVEMIPYSKENNDFRYLLTIIDLFSKFAFAIPIKYKNADQILNAFTKVFKIRKPKKLQTDNGTEFYNQKVQKLFKENKIEHFSTISDLKACVVERFNRTLKEKMWKVFSKNDNKKWINIVDKLVDNYNNSYHRSIKMTPNQASKTENVEIVHNNLYPNGCNEINEKESKFKIGDKVRMSRYKTKLSKGYTPNWTIELFTVKEVFNTNPYTYSIVDQLGEDITGRYYDYDLVLYDKKDDVLKIEAIIQTRKKMGKKEFLVKWKGYPEKFNSWVKEDDLIS